MKLAEIFLLFTLSVMTKGAWLAAVVQPVILSIGAILSAIDLEVLEPIEWKNFLKSDKDDKEPKAGYDDWDNDSVPRKVP